MLINIIMCKHGVISGSSKLSDAFIWFHLHDTTMPGEKIRSPEYGELDISVGLVASDPQFSWYSSLTICWYLHSMLQNAFSPLQQRLHFR